MIDRLLKRLFSRDFTITVSPDVFHFKCGDEELSLTPVIYLAQNPSGARLLQVGGGSVPTQPHQRIDLFKPPASLDPVTKHEYLEVFLRHGMKWVRSKWALIRPLVIFKGAASLEGVLGGEHYEGLKRIALTAGARECRFEKLDAVNKRISPTIIRPTERRSVFGWVSTFLGFLAIWTILSIMGLWFFSMWPKTPLGWSLALAIGPVVFIIFELLGELAHSGFQRIPGLAGLRSKAEMKGEGRSISGARMSYLFVEILLFVGIAMLLVWAVSRLLGDTLEPVSSFFERHYG